jgi:hypothetical protein
VAVQTQCRTVADTHKVTKVMERHGICRDLCPKGPEIHKLTHVRRRAGVLPSQGRKIDDQKEPPRSHAGINVLACPPDGLHALIASTALRRGMAPRLILSHRAGCRTVFSGLRCVGKCESRVPIVGNQRCCGIECTVIVIRLGLQGILGGWPSLEE